MFSHPSLRDRSPQRIINEQIRAANPVGTDLISSPVSSGASYVSLGCVQKTQRPPLLKSHARDAHSHRADGEDSSAAAMKVRSGVHLTPQVPIVLITEAARSWKTKHAGIAYEP